MANMYKIFWKEHEDSPVQDQLVEADIVEHAGNLLIFAQILKLPVPSDTVEDAEMLPEHLVGADPYDELYKKAQAADKKTNVPHVVFMIPIVRVVKIEKLTPGGAH